VADFGIRPILERIGHLRTYVWVEQLSRRHWPGQAMGFRGRKSCPCHDGGGHGDQAQGLPGICRNGAGHGG
jgi:hypothetical protein